MSKPIDAKEPSEEVAIKNMYFKQPSTNYRYIKVVAKKLGVLPEWHIGHEHDGRSWLFVDEITVK